eukprot:TRINITY_DN18467_c0_g1_i1.p1 TRINITY_DN18467_c0_g1~~TRINITY_DN18467_c0_g1_i1.p1  ORF type:complete len:115 (-),score=7.07 TRINITY_DN18467_c0_g1_i1:64-369(-)
MNARRNTHTGTGLHYDYRPFTEYQEHMSVKTNRPSKARRNTHPGTGTGLHYDYRPYSKYKENMSVKTDRPPILAVLSAPKHLAKWVKGRFSHSSSKTPEYA